MSCYPAREHHVHAFTWPTCEPVTFYETTVICAGGILNVYVRTVSLDVVEGCLTLARGDWEYSHAAGCCDCDSGTGIGTDCCENVLPSVLTITITGKSGACSCLPDEIDMVYGGLNLGNPFWSAVLGLDCTNPSSP